MTRHEVLVRQYAPHSPDTDDLIRKLDDSHAQYLRWFANHNRLPARTSCSAEVLFLYAHITDVTVSMLARDEFELIPEYVMWDQFSIDDLCLKSVKVRIPYRCVLSRPFAERVQLCFAGRLDYGKEPPHRSGQPYSASHHLAKMFLLFARNGCFVLCKRRRCATTDTVMTSWWSIFSLTPMI